MTIYDIARVLSAMASGLFLIGSSDHQVHRPGHTFDQQIDRAYHQ